VVVVIGVRRQYCAKGLVKRGIRAEKPDRGGDTVGEHGAVLMPFELLEGSCPKSQWTIGFGSLREGGSQSKQV